MSARARLRAGVIGAHRFADAVGLASIVIAALLVARTNAPSLAALLAERTWNAKLFATILEGVPADQKCGVTQFYTFVFALSFVSAAALLAASTVWLVARWRRGRMAALALDACAFVGAVVSAARLNAFVAGMALLVIVVLALALARYCGRGVPLELPSSARASAGVVVVSEAIALGYTLWFLDSPQFGPVLLIPVFALIVFAAMRVGRAAEAGDSAVVRDALAGAPLLGLPLIGLLRDPSHAWVAVALVATAGLRAGLERRSPRSVPAWLAAVLAPTAVAAVFLLPLRFRELPTANHRVHEAQHLAWITSALHGRFLFADASLTYPPGREYLIMLVAWLMGGIRLDHVRLAHVFLNLAGVAVLLYVGWHVVQRRIWPFALWWWLILVMTPAAFFLNYPDEICFGWADDLRAGFATLALFLALRAGDALSDDERTRPRSLWRLFASGLVAACAVLYSHDCGVAAIAAAGVTLVADAFLRRRRLDWTGRARRAVAACSALAAGAVSGVGLPILYYVARGRGHALLEALRYQAVLSAGMSGALAAQLSVNDFLQANTLFGEVEKGWKLDYYFPLFVPMAGAAAVIASALRAGWSSRTSLLCGLTLFSAAMFRYGLTRADPWHVCAAAVPSYLLLVMLLADGAALRFRVTLRSPVRVPVGLAVFACLIVFTMCKMPNGRGLAARANRIAAGLELPSTGEPYHAEGLVRTGDENVENWPTKLARYVREHTSADDEIWVVTSRDIGGGEIYFLSDRADATPFDVWDEVVTRHDADRVLAALRTHPPALILGQNFDYAPEIVAYVEAHWKIEALVEDVAIRRYDPKTL